MRTAVTKTTLNGMPFNEKQIISSTVIDEMVFEYVIFDAKESVDINTREIELALVKNAAFLKAINE